jgi:hypothetical protein
VPARRPRWLPRDPWSVAAALCLFGGAVLLVVAWYDISGTANVYEQLPYLVSAGFAALALIIVGSALLVAGRGDRVERRMAQLVDALTEAAAGAAPAPPTEPAQGPPARPDTFLTVAGGRTYHRPDCLLLKGKETTAANPSDIESNALTPCPVCGPGRPA